MGVFFELWNNKTNILKNYLGIINRYLPDITILIILFALIIIYAYTRYNGFLLHRSHNHNHNQNHNLIELSNMNDGFNDGFTEGFTEGFADHPNTDDIIPDNITMPTTLFITPESQKHILQTMNNTYLSIFNQPNIQARGFDTRAELIRTYNKCLIPITDNEKKTTWTRICNFIESLRDIRQKKYIYSWLDKIQIAKGATWLESGMPHTHDNCIIMRPDWFGAHFKSNTFIHELIHVIQRKGINIQWDKLYNEWHFIQATKLSGLESYLNLNRTNPDGISTNWVWQSPVDDKYYWIAAVYKSVTPNTLTDVNYLAIPITKTSRENTFKYTGITPKQLSKFSEFLDYFGLIMLENHYHPNEIASQFAEYYFSADTNTDTDTNTDKNIHMQKYPGYVIFSKWLDQLL